jgi:hypothetical protein
MAPRSSRSKFNVAHVLPIWKPSHTGIVNDLFLSILERFGVTDVHTYFERMRIVIAISVVISACLGGYHYGFGGFISGGVLGVIAPVVVLWLGILVTGIAIFMGIYFAAWAVMFYLAKWLITGQLG